MRFAVIGDYGLSGPDELAVSELVESWQVDFIVTTGDNNYPNGESETIDENIGQYYHNFIGDYQGLFGTGSSEPRFFPSIGNHDWNRREGYEPYLAYFTLPGNERYYDVVQGAVHLFVVNSDTNEPDGVGRSTAQASWLQAALADSDAVWQLVVMHHPPYSSGHHTSTEWMQWPFVEWGTDAVLAGHDHLFERLEVEGIPFITNGLGGSPAIYDFPRILPESLVRYNETHGAMLVEATSQWIRFDFINIQGELIDSLTLTAD
ncbi:MAG: metallophosphoesterase [Anaerolineales bacterium]